jgi:hypothetical protein
MRARSSPAARLLLLPACSLSIHEVKQFPDRRPLLLLRDDDLLMTAREKKVTLFCKGFTTKNEHFH